MPLQSPLVVAEAVREQRPLWVDDVEAPEWAVPHPGWADLLGGLGIRGVIALPLIAGGRAVGVHGRRVPRASGRDCAIERATLRRWPSSAPRRMDRARLYRAEHRVAETLQRSLLPQRLPQLPRLALDARYLPGAEGVQAGGDWYDVIELDEHRVAIAVGDVVGQGAAAAPRSWGSCAARWPPPCCRGTGPPRRWSCSTGSPPGSPGRARPRRRA